MIELHWAEIDGVTTVWTDAPRPLRAGLLFRAGRADETLATSGRTHLIEHLAFSEIDEKRHRYQGSVGGILTSFFTMGESQEVVRFFASICDTLTSLPGDRLESEKQVLLAERAGRRYDSRANLVSTRYGPAGYGLFGMPEMGFQKATIEDLREYSAQRFTKENAVLWLSGPPPTDLRLSLPNGKRWPLPPLLSLRRTVPSWFLLDTIGGVAAGAPVPRVSASTVFRAIAYGRLRDQLRTARGLSYAPAVFYNPLNTDTAHLVLYADSANENRQEMVVLFDEIFKGLNEFEDAEVETAREQISESLTGSLAPPLADRMVQEASRAAMSWIFWEEFESLESLVASLSSVTVEDVSAIGSDIQARAMFALSPGVPLLPSFGVPTPVSTGPAVQGQEATSVDAPIVKKRLVYSPDGVSVLEVNGSHITIRYANLAGAFYYEDGCIFMMSLDGVLLRIEPTLWRDGQNICCKIRERIPEHLMLEQRTRPADAIPKPKTTAWQRFRARLPWR